MNLLNQIKIFFKQNRFLMSRNQQLTLFSNFAKNNIIEEFHIIKLCQHQGLSEIQIH